MPRTSTIMTIHARRPGLVLAAVLGLAIIPAVVPTLAPRAEAQTAPAAPATLQPPTPGKPPTPPTIMTLFAAVVILGGAFAANCLAPKRGHQD